MGVLDKVFAGKKGLLNVLADKLGGTVRLVYVNEFSYDEQNNKDAVRESYQVLPFIPSENTSIENPAVVSGASEIWGMKSQSEVVLSDKTCAGTIPSANVIREPVSGRDRFERGGIVYRLTSVKPNYVGDSLISYFLSGVQV